ncbi:Uncharacterized protein APZ42_005325 [Daphnia magna]|uniref:Uncharacterized protein n=1 Tax=Daphnia magna TaxID=35525 RepID=A0A164GIE5_9CRUS|nr:Uncharacterized protein APZ42_005325 [Daphnia magna]
MRLPAITLRLQSTTLPQATTLKQLQNTIRGQIFLNSSAFHLPYLLVHHSRSCSITLMSNDVFHTKMFSLTLRI